MAKMQELYEKVANDSVLQAKFFEIMKNVEEAGEAATGENLIGFAKDAGYDITLDEMKEFFRELTESKEGALMDAELDMAAGGKSDRGIQLILWSVATVGLACAIGSIIEEAIYPGDCGPAFK